MARFLRICLSRLYISPCILDIKVVMMIKASKMVRTLASYIALIVFIVIVSNGCASIDERHATKNVCTTIDACARAIQQKVMSNWKLPIGGQYLMTTIQVSLDEHFGVVDVSFEGSDYDEDFNNSALAAIYVSSPFSELSGLTVEDSKNFNTVRLEFKPRGF